MKEIADAAELQERGIEILVRELGYVNAMRFLLQWSSGRGDYTEERKELFACWTLSDALGAMDRLGREAGTAGKKP